MHCFFVAGISGIENVCIQFYSPDVLGKKNFHGYVK
jgi:hypothetical protein